MNAKETGNKIGEETEERHKVPQFYKNSITLAKYVIFQIIRTFPYYTFCKPYE